MLKQIIHRAAAGALAACLLLTLPPVSALAAGTEFPCGHVHDGFCGYLEAVEGVPCAHRNGDDAYSCAPEGAGEGYACAHDDGCGYVEAVEGRSCVHTCDVCNPPEAPACLCDPRAAEADGVHTNPDCPFYAEPDEADALCAAIDALPTVDELYENAPGDADPAFDAWVSETRALLAEVPALWERLSALTEDTEAMARITDARAEKLAALNHLTERLGETQTLDTTVAYIGDTPYGTLADAFAAASSTDPQNPTVIELGKDLTFGADGDVTAGITVPAGKSVKLTSKGGSAFTISRKTANETKDYFFKVYDGCTLILENVVLDGKNLSTGGEHYFAAVAGAELILETGAKLMNNTSPTIRAGTGNYSNTISAITMNGGEISGNSAGGIQMLPNFSSQSGKTLRFTMNGGTIKNNTKAAAGAGIYGSNSSLSCTTEVIIHGGEITGNTSTVSSTDTVTGGGGVYCDSVFRMDGGTISGNTANRMGGGVYLSGVSEAGITGGTISNNTASGLADTKKGKGDNLYVNKTQNLALSPTENIDGIFLYLGASLKIPSALAHTITLEGAYQRNAQMIGLPVATGASSYTITADDLAKFSYAENAFGFALDGNQIKLANPSYPVTFHLTGMQGHTSSTLLPTGIEKGKDLMVQLVASSGYKLPAASVTVKVGGMELAASEYQLQNFSNSCSIGIGQAKITGAVEITAKAQVKGSDATLSALTYWYASTPGNVGVPGFSSDAQNPTYNVILPADVAKDATIYVDKTKSDSNATSSTDPSPITLVDGKGTWKVTITSEDGAKTNTYTVNFTTASTVTVVSGEGGTATASPVSAAAGETVTLTAMPGSGYRFKEWQVVGGGASIVDVHAATTTFEMPGEAVEVKAVFELQTTPPTTYTVTLRDGGSGASGNGSYAFGATVTISAGSLSGYSFNGWTVVSGGITPANPNQSTTTFEMPAANVEVQANWSRNSTGGSDNGSSNNGSSNSSSGYTPPTITDPKPNVPTTAETDVTAKTDSKGNAKIDVPRKVVDNAIDKALDAAKKNGAEDNGVAVQINVATGKSATGKAADSITVNLPKATQERLIAAEVSRFTLVMNRPDIAISLNLDSIKEINAQAGADVQLTAARITDAAALSGAARDAIGTRPAFRLSASYRGGKVTDFGEGSVGVALPYTLRAGELAANLCAVYVNDHGEATYLTDSSYDLQRGVLLFETGHFSIYGVGYKAPAAFRDIEGHWAEADIAFVAARGLLNGTDAGLFSPDAPMTRAMLVAALGRLAGVGGDEAAAFTDVPAAAYYAPYVRWAASKGVVKGTGGGRFSPDDPVSRQEMAAILSNYAAAMGCEVPANHEAAAFADGADIASFADGAVRRMQRAGVMTGRDGGRFDPASPSTRAEAAAILRRYLELVIDRQSA